MDKLRVKVIVFSVLIIVGIVTSVYYMYNYKSFAESPSQDMYKKQLVNSIFEGSYGEIKKSDSQKNDNSKNMTVYEDDKYAYTFKENSEIFSIIQQNEFSEKSEQVNLSKEDTIKKVKGCIDKIYPSLNYDNIIMETELGGGYEPWQITMTYNVGKDEITTGMIFASLNQFGEISSLIIDGEFNEKIEISENFISEQNAVNIAYVEAELFSKVTPAPAQEQSDSKKESDSDEFIITDSGKKILVEEKEHNQIELPEYDFSDKENHEVVTNLEKREGNYFWNIKISNVKCKNYDYKKSFFVKIDAVTSEIIYCFSSR